MWISLNLNRATLKDNYCVDKLAANFPENISGSYGIIHLLNCTANDFSVRSLLISSQIERNPPRCNLFN